MLGRKQVPEIVESKSTSEEGNWAFNTLRQHIEYGTGNKRHGHPTAYTTTNEEIDNTAYAFIMRQEGIMYLLRGLEIVSQMRENFLATSNRTYTTTTHQ